MVQNGQRAARVSMLIEASPQAIYTAFVDPAWLTRFWLNAADVPLAIGKASKWEFKVPGAKIETAATRLDEHRAISWQWSDGTSVDIDLELSGSATAVTIIVKDFAGDASAQAEAALNVCEGFAIVLCDLKTLLESGTSAGLVAAKAKLIERRTK